MEREDFDIRDNQLTSRERDFENALRPLSFEDFSGQDKVVDNLRIFVKAARLRGEALDHVLPLLSVHLWHFQPPLLQDKEFSQKQCCLYLSVLFSAWIK